MSNWKVEETNASALPDKSIMVKTVVMDEKGCQCKKLSSTDELPTVHVRDRSVTCLGVVMRSILSRKERAL